MRSNRRDDDPTSAPARGGAGGRLSLLAGPAPERCGRCPLGVASGPAPCPFHDLERPAGSMLLAQGERPACAWWVRVGTVLLSATTASGDETSCTLRGPGSLIGLEGLRGLATSYEAWALTDVQLCRIGVADLESWLGRGGDPSRVVLDLALEEMARWQLERVAMGGQTVTRIARFLLRHLAVDGARRTLPFELQVLARMLGMRPETLSRGLRRLREKGALAPGPGVRIVDEKALLALAGEDDGDGSAGPADE